ncbi:MAG: glycosyltransferase family 4 protein [Desulfobacteraceae bacterium]|nr:glycosyltransferase family 4 protein [Desulfobacteraceae bacterium]
MKVLYCITRSDTIGGAHVHVADLAKWMREEGHDAIVAVGGYGVFCRHLAQKNIPYINCRFLGRPISPAKDISALMELCRILRQQKPDLLSLHSAKAGLLGRFSSLGTDVPTVFTAHGWSFTEGISPVRAYISKILEKIAVPFTDRIITVSDYDRALALDAGLCPEKKIITIHNGMPDTKHFSEPGRNQGPVKITMIARLDEQKDHATLFSALSNLKDYNWTLDLIGDGPKEQILRKLSDFLSLSRRVNFLGLRDDVENLLAKSQIFVLATKWEGFPRSILEAMRAGLPVIASAVGGVSEAVKNGETGYLVPRMDSDVLRDRIKTLLCSPEQRKQMGLAGRRSFEKNFLFERMAEKTLAVYKQLAGQN